MSTAQQKALSWCGVVFLALLTPGVLMLGLIPPAPPSWSAEQIAHFWSTNTGLKQAGLVLILLAVGFTVPFGAMLALRIKQIEGRRCPWTFVELIATGLAFIAIELPMFIFAAASYRPERDPQITQALNDLGWLAFIMNWPPAALQCLAIGFAILGNPRTARPVWPRWVAYFNFWCAFAFADTGLAVLFKLGPFAWNGLLALYLVGAIFGAWCLVMTWQLLRAVDPHVRADEEIG